MSWSKEAKGLAGLVTFGFCAVMILLAFFHNSGQAPVVTPQSLSPQAQYMADHPDSSSKPVPVHAGDKNGYAKYIGQYGADLATAERWERLGYEICDALAAGSSRTDLVDTLRGKGYSKAGATTLITGADLYLCDI